MKFNWFNKEKKEEKQETDIPKGDEALAEEGVPVKSLYEYIKAHCENGALPDHFSLPEEEQQGQLKFADGAMDGILMYHMAGSQLDEAEMAKMKEIVGLISEGNMEKADAALREFAKKNRALSVIDDFEDYIRKNSGDLSTENIYRFGVKEIRESDHKECVKFGLEIMELFTLKNENVKDVIRTLGLCDEFTLFVVFIMLGWENANEEIFNLAKKVKGWGRIHAIEKLKPETEEIKEWLLKEGIRNQVMPEYSALTCFEKSDAAKRLEGEISREEFQSIGTILSAMLVEGPVPGISGVKNSQDVLLQYLAHAKEQTPELSDYETILKICHYGKKEGVRKAALSVLKEWTEKEKKSLKEISFNLYRELEDMVEKEVCDDVKLEMKELLV